MARPLPKPEIRPGTSIAHVIEEQFHEVAEYFGGDRNSTHARLGFGRVKKDGKHLLRIHRVNGYTDKFEQKDMELSAEVVDKIFSIPQVDESPEEVDRRREQTRARGEKRNRSSSVPAGPSNEDRRKRAKIDGSGSDADNVPPRKSAAA